LEAGRFSDRHRARRGSPCGGATNDNQRGYWGQLAGVVQCPFARWEWETWFLVECQKPRISWGKREQPGQTGAANAEMYNSRDTSKKTKIRLKIR
jgi:hypothetical protein